MPRQIYSSAYCPLGTTWPIRSDTGLASSLFLMVLETISTQLLTPVYVHRGVWRLITVVSIREFACYWGEQQHVYPKLPSSVAHGPPTSGADACVKAQILHIQLQQLLGLAPRLGRQGESFEFIWLAFGIFTRTRKMTCAFFNMALLMIPTNKAI